MTFDDGNSGSTRTSDDDFQAKIRAAMKRENIPWGELCSMAGVHPDEAHRAIVQGTYGLPGTFPVLQKICNALNRDIGWLVAGTTDAEERFKTGLAEKVTKLVWEFAYKAELTKSEGERLVRHVLSMVERLSANTLQAAHRTGIPRTWKDVAFIYERLAQPQVPRPRLDD